MRNGDLNAVIDELRVGVSTWAGLGLEERADLLVDLRDSTSARAADWVEIACSIKGLDPNSPAAGEEWLSGPYALLGGIEALIASLSALATGRSPLDGFKTTEAPGGRVAVRVLPHNLFERLLLNGFTAEVWSKPGVTTEQLHDVAGLDQRSPEQTHGVGVVLGAGNIFSITPLDALYELFANNRVVLLKLNPITDPLKPVLETVFAQFLALGLMRIVSGGTEVGAAAVKHQGIDHVHITGSIHSHNAIVFGTDG